MLGVNYFWKWRYLAYEEETLVWKHSKFECTVHNFTIFVHVRIFWRDKIRYTVKKLVNKKRVTVIWYFSEIAKMVWKCKGIEEDRLSK